LPVDRLRFAEPAGVVVFQGGLQRGFRHANLILHGKRLFIVGKIFASAVVGCFAGFPV
jgi:hypothetical protein